MGKPGKGKVVTTGDAKTYSLILVARILFINGEEDLGNHSSSVGAGKGDISNHSCFSVVGLRKQKRFPVNS